LSKPLSIDPAVLRRLRNLPKDARAECLFALCELPESFGRPHVHSGLGIRKLGEKIFERRGNVSLRFIFQDRPSELFVCFLGNQIEVKALLQTRKQAH
jgi:hypothetical protein